MTIYENRGKYIQEHLRVSTKPSEYLRKSTTTNETPQKPMEIHENR